VPNGEAPCLPGAACFGDAPNGEAVFEGGDPEAPGDPAFGTDAPNGEAEVPGDLGVPFVAEGGETFGWSCDVLSPKVIDDGGLALDFSFLVFSEPSPLTSSAAILSVFLTVDDCCVVVSSCFFSRLEIREFKRSFESPVELSSFFSSSFSSA